ncbi:DUF2764 family protein [Roseiconus lacunae]|uniref:DUF2764 family protein n=1 Tax=Roseiconus lacunae TaxID=2605694 RepID=UPI001E4B38A6|nr:DUF2764 family protein [Roseiconus lacunae]MCD0460228.1 DUF2764 domain-containing protein [Roseiconus lacunae]
MMYYDLIASLPRLPHFESAERVPITPLRLNQRLTRLHPAHAEQIHRARSQVTLRPSGIAERSEDALIQEHDHLLQTGTENALQDFLVFRMTQRIVVAALRRFRAGLEPWRDLRLWQASGLLFQIRKNWDVPFFKLQHLYPWVTQVSTLLRDGDAIGLERLLSNLNWHWLSRCSERSMFGFPAVMAFVFKWDMIQAWLACSDQGAKVRFTNLIDEVTHESQR